jgi:hypothetical protein
MNLRHFLSISPFVHDGLAFLCRFSYLCWNLTAHEVMLLSGRMSLKRFKDAISEFLAMPSERNSPGRSGIADARARQKLARLLPEIRHKMRSHPV